MAAGWGEGVRLIVNEQFSIFREIINGSRKCSWNSCGQNLYLYCYVPRSWLQSRGQMLEFQLTMKLSKMKVVLWDLDSQLLISEKIESVKHSFSPVTKVMICRSCIHYKIPLVFIQFIHCTHPASVGHSFIPSFIHSTNVYRWLAMFQKHVLLFRIQQWTE